MNYFFIRYVIMYQKMILYSSKTHYLQIFSNLCRFMSTYKVLEVAIASTGRCAGAIDKKRKCLHNGCNNTRVPDGVY